MAKNAESAATAELTLEQVLKDPITQLLMEKDGVTAGHVYELAERARKAAASSRTR